MTLRDAAIVALAPNGGRLQKHDHAHLPLSFEELAAEALACREAGASLMHFHVRDREGRHSLDDGLYREALAVLQAQVPSMLFQISSEALGRYNPEEQARCVFQSGCKLASVAFREMSADSRANARRFYAEARERGIHLQHILYSPAEAEGLIRTLDELGGGREGGGREGGARDQQGEKDKICLLFVYGRYGEGMDEGRGDEGEGAASMPSFAHFLRACHLPFAERQVVWFLCSFGRHEQDRLLKALQLGGHARVGFENNLLKSDGSVAENNACQVASLLDAMRAQGVEQGQKQEEEQEEEQEEIPRRKVASFAETCALLGLARPL